MEKPVTTKVLLLAAFLLLAGCKENDCQGGNATDYKNEFSFCMDKAAQVQVDGSHDNRYDLVSACESYAHTEATRMCMEKP